MKKYTPADLAAVPLYPLEKMTFIKELSAPVEWQFQPGCGIDGDVKFADGIYFKNEFTLPFPDTALNYVKKLLDAKNINSNGNYEVSLIYDDALKEFEEYTIDITDRKTIIAAGSCEGMRRALYNFAELLRSTEGASLSPTSIHQKSWAKRRISRCFFAPTYRAPFFIDELNNEVDYYPENYLERLAADGVNGLWISIYFRDLPSDIFPGRGKDSEKRFAKLRQVVKRCADYGIKIYLYCSEPKQFGTGTFAVPMDDAVNHPEVVGSCGLGSNHYFCMSSDTAKKYLRDSAFQIFRAVPELGGLLNIIFGEDNGSCVHPQMYDRARKVHCPKCGHREPGEMFAESAQALYEGMHAAAPDAELICWFYAPGIRDHDNLARRLEKAVDHFPPHSTIMFNFESGGVSQQFGKGRNVYDYSLAFVGPSDLFRYSAENAAHTGAKLQVCCSHEDASVPFIPVPGNLYRKYETLHEYNIETILQCWYFGNYPGLMNRTAGYLSSHDFKGTEKDFLVQQARADWGKYAEKAVKAWQFFGESYRNFPSNIGFAWYGPMHNSIAWPLHLFPVDKPIAPSWILKHFPEVSGDRIGECLIFQHTLAEAVSLLEQMNILWQQGLQEMIELRKIFKDVKDRVRDIDLAEAIGIQIRSTLNCVKFYYLREDMLFNHNDQLTEMRTIVTEEISLSRTMGKLCESDPRLGYHSEAENYLFYPEKLDMRIKLLEQLQEDFDNFDLNADWIPRYTGKIMDGHKHSLKNQDWHDLPETEISYRIFREDQNIITEIKGHLGRPVVFEIEPCRLWPPMRIDIDRNGAAFSYDFIHRTNPDIKMQDTDENGFFRAEIPLKIFDGFRRDGFPMRFHIRSLNDCQHGKYTPWPGRLLQEDYNPETASWLYDIE